MKSVTGDSVTPPREGGVTESVTVTVCHRLYLRECGRVTIHHRFVTMIIVTDLVTDSGAGGQFGCVVISGVFHPAQDLD